MKKDNSQLITTFGITLKNYEPRKRMESIWVARFTLAM